MHAKTSCILYQIFRFGHTIFRKESGWSCLSLACVEESGRFAVDSLSGTSVCLAAFLDFHVWAV